jgi:tetratricopeptide (TPR) repeat protein
MAKSRRSKKKGKALTTLEVRCESWDEFAAVYANDISLGGIYIETDERPELMSTVEIKLLLPEGHEVRFKANVVHLPSAEEAEKEGRAEGVGLEFRNLEAMMKKQLWHLVEYAKWEAGAPGARSYAAALMEFAESQAEAGADSEAWRSLSPPPLEEEELEEEEEDEDELQSEEASRPSSVEPEPAVAASAPPGPGAEAEGMTSSPAPSGPRSQRPVQREDATPMGIPEPLHEQSVPPAAEAGRSMRPISGRATEAARKLAASLRTKTAAVTGRAAGAPAAAGHAAGAPAAAGHAAGAIAGPTPRSLRVSQTPSTVSREKLSVAFKDIAYKRYDMAIRTLEALVTQEPDNKKARIWLNIARARRAIQRGRRREAATFFQAVLELDEQNHEAHKFVKAFERDEKVKNVPFARYFTKKQ